MNLRKCNANCEGKTTEISFFQNVKGKKGILVSKQHKGKNHDIKG